MKKIILLLLLFSGFVAQAQYGYGNRQNQRQRQNQQRQQRPQKPKFDARKYLGFVNYDIEKAAKKTGLKTSSDVGKKFVHILKEYNNSTNQIQRINSFTLKSMKGLVESSQKKVMDGGDPSTLQTVQKTVQESFKPIADTLKEEREKLHKTLETLLSKKQFQKWQKFDRKVRK
ncbi:MAG: hypothetical protein ACPGTO_00865 [Polaribacter sp.]